MMEIILVQAGFDKTTAKTLSPLLDGKPKTVKGLTREAHLSTASVSFGTNELIRRGIVQKTFRHMGAVGRPKSVYVLCKPASEVLEDVREELREKLEIMAEGLRLLDDFPVPTEENPASQSSRMTVSLPDLPMPTAHGEDF